MDLVCCRIFSSISSPPPPCSSLAPRVLYVSKSPVWLVVRLHASNTFTSPTCLTNCALPPFIFLERTNKIYQRSNTTFLAHNTQAYTRAPSPHTHIHIRKHPRTRTQKHTKKSKFTCMLDQMYFLLNLFNEIALHIQVFCQCKVQT